MSEICYIDKKFSETHQHIIFRARRICEETVAEGFDLTLRQLYYRFVAGDYFPDDWTWSQSASGGWVKDSAGTKNAEPNYKRLGSIINDARLAGLLDWKYIIDRTRELEELAHWNSPADLVSAAANQFRYEKWADQEYVVYCFIEKDALIGVLEAACRPLDVPYFSCRGYTSQSSKWSIAQKMGDQIRAGQKVMILHLGDHDPSGIDMTRDIEERLSMFVAQDLDLYGPGETTDPQDYVYELAGQLEVSRIALNMDQIRQYAPPPNPAKVTDSRAKNYIAKYGAKSWELDALPVRDLVEIVQQEVIAHRDDDLWNAQVEREKSDGEVLKTMAVRWEDVKTYLGGEKND